MPAAVKAPGQDSLAKDNVRKRITIVSSFLSQGPEAVDDDYLQGVRTCLLLLTRAGNVPVQSAEIGRVLCCCAAAHRARATSAALRWLSSDMQLRPAGDRSP